jgi:hypothetical protein
MAGTQFPTSTIGIPCETADEIPELLLSGWSLNNPQNRIRDSLSIFAGISLTAGIRTGAALVGSRHSISDMSPTSTAVRTPFSLFAFDCCNDFCQKRLHSPVSCSSMLDFYLNLLFSFRLDVGEVP